MKGFSPASRSIRSAEPLDRFKSLSSSRRVELEYSDALGRAEETSHGGHNTVRPDLSVAEAFWTFAHELAHEPLHHAETCGRLSKTALETEAVAFVVSYAVGLDTNSACSDYIQFYCAN
ncbi:MAG: hypothetical protein IH987_05590 [Planctomycetes bacterium]|nr:hypothetical protein [Planctomycetota bacterium]